MRRMMVLVTMVLLMTAMVVVMVAPALAVAGPPARAVSSGGVPVDPMACEMFANGSGMFAWREGGVCWFTPPAL